MNEELTRDIYQRLGGIEAKLDDVRFIRDTANDAQKKAEMAQQTAEDNDKNLDNLTSTMKWAFGLIVPTIVSIAIAVITLIV